MNGRGTRWLLALLLLVQFVLVSRQVSDEVSGAPLLERAMVAALGPPAHALAALQEAAGSVGRRARTHRALREENRRLRKRLGDLERELLRFESLENDFQRLAAAVRYSRSTRRPVRVTDVVSADYGSFLESLLLFVGPRGADTDQAAVHRNGLVGRVVAVGGAYAKVQLVTDRASAVGAMIARTGRQGVVRGAGDGRLSMEYVPLQADVRVGDRILTAGMDGVYPRGLPVGTVTDVTPGRQLFHRIEVVPAVDFGHLDAVYLLEEEAVGEAGGLDPGAFR